MAYLEASVPKPGVYVHSCLGSSIYNTASGNIVVRKAQSSVAVALSSALPPVVKTPDGIHNRQRFASLRERFTASAPALGPRGRLTRGVCVCV